MMSELSALPNVGKVLEKNLHEIGIITKEDLIKTGSEQAFIFIRRIDPGACLHMLYGIQGAIEGIKDSKLSSETKAALKEFYKSL
jgi:DNA transformation protein and related proteins